MFIYIIDGMLFMRWLKHAVDEAAVSYFLPRNEGEMIWQ
jgi:hypothetical protein